MSQERVTSPIRRAKWQQVAIRRRMHAALLMVGRLSTGKVKTRSTSTLDLLSNCPVSSLPYFGSLETQI